MTAHGSKNTTWCSTSRYFRYKNGDLSRKRESSEQFVWYGETEMQLRRWAMMPSIQADWSQDEVI